MQRPPSRSSTSTNTPLWPEGHPRHAVNSWLREQWGPQQSNTSMPSTASLPQQARRRKWSFNMGTSPFTSGYTRQPATPAYSPNIRDRRSSLSSMDSMPDLNHMHLESDPDDPQTATAQKFPTSSGQQIHDADSGIWHEVRAPTQSTVLSVELIPHSTADG